MEIEDLKPAWKSYKVRETLAKASVYSQEGILELLEPSKPASIGQKVLGAGVMLLLIFVFCQGG